MFYCYNRAREYSACLQPNLFQLMHVREERSKCTWVSESLRLTEGTSVITLQHASN